jgi:predicted DNA-binding protein (UPF0251 family)
MRITIYTFLYPRFKYNLKEDLSMCPCKGRRRGRRWISEVPPVGSFVPEGSSPENITFVSLTLEELETVRLVDLLELEQEEASFYMGISRKALWNDLISARKKIAAALVYGAGIKIEGGSYMLREGGCCPRCPGRVQEWRITREDEMSLLEREVSILQDRLAKLSTRMASLKGNAAVENEEGTT